MELITKVTSFTKDNKTKIVFNDSIFLPIAYVTKLTGLHSMHNLLIGSSIEVDYYTTGETIREATEASQAMLCTKDNTIVKEARIELSDKLQSFALAAAFGTTVSLK